MADSRVLSWSRSAPVKLTVLAFLTLLLLVPAAMVRSLVHERRARHAAVVDEVSGRWGRPQTLLGPVLSTPYRSVRRSVSGADGRIAETFEEGALDALPEHLAWRGRLVPEVRARGIYQVVVYTAHLHGEGVIRRPSPSPHGIPAGDLAPSRTILALGVEDLRGLVETPRVTIAGAERPVVSGTASALLGSGLHVAVPELGDADPEQGMPFTIDLVLRGSGTLLLPAAGGTTIAELTGGWPSPSFTGAFLPRRHELTAGGFTAAWEVPSLARGFPQTWRSTGAAPSAPAHELRGAGFGVELVIPADAYQQTDRALKYALLVIGLTFLTILLLELFGGVRLHSMHYLLPGVGLCLFYLLLLALAEHLGFAAAYLAAAAATTLLLATYARSVLASGRRGALLGGALSGLYAFLFVVLRSEDYALLLGAVALFAILALVMYLTRRLDWTTLEVGRQPGTE